jgi:hypothetical protein
MAILKQVGISFNFFGDGVSTVITLDLEKDPFTVGPTPNSVLWTQDIRANKPVSAVVNGNTTVARIHFVTSLSYPILTFTFDTPPGNGEDTVSTNLLF